MAGVLFLAIVVMFLLIENVVDFEKECRRQDKLRKTIREKLDE